LRAGFEVIHVPEFNSNGTDLYIDGKKVLRGWESFSGWYWFATEESHKQDSMIEGKVYPNDTIYFGFVQGFEEEWGYFSKAELERLRSKVWEIKKCDMPYAGRRR